MKQGPLCNRLTKGLVGLVQIHPQALLTELAGMCGYDFLMLDGEHGTFTDGDYAQAVQALSATDALAFVRVPGHDAHVLGKCLDVGADAIVVPHVSTAEEARALARAMSYPPAGTRSYGASGYRTTRYGMNTTAYSKAARQSASLIVMIESALGVANVEDILSVDGVDGVLVGPADLAAALDCAGDFSHPEYADALDRIECAAARTGKFLGAPAHPGHPFEALLARGYRLLVAGADVSLYRESLTSQLTRVRDCLQSAK